MPPQVDPVEAITSAIRHWPSLDELATFALKQQGYGNSDGGFGITYPSDQDEFDQINDGVIPSGMIRVYGFWGPPDGYEICVSEAVYLRHLADALEKAGLSPQALAIREHQTNIE